MCQSRFRLQVHHKTYARLGKERLEDLQVLCFNCHKLIHPDLGKPRKIKAERKRRGPRRVTERFTQDYLCSVCGETKRGTLFKADQRKDGVEARICRNCHKLANER